MAGNTTPNQPGHDLTLEEIEAKFDELMKHSSRGGFCMSEGCFDHLTNYDTIMAQNSRFAVKPVIDSRYRAIIPWDGYLMRATSHFMERIMTEVMRMIDDRAVFGMVIDGFDYDGEKTHYELGSCNIAYTKSILARESCFNVQWVRVTFSVLVNGKVHETTEVNPEHFLNIVGDMETGYEVECFPREMERFINPKDRAMWEDEAWDNLDLYL